MKAQKLTKKYLSDTPKLVKIIQTASGAVTATMLAYDLFPDTFKVMDANTAKIIMLASLVVIFVSQFFEKKK